MNLIEELGLENAKALDGMLQKHAVTESWKIAVINGMWQRSSVGFTHGELRTAIAEHDQHWYGQSEEKELEQYALLSQEKIEGGARLVGDFTSIQQQLQSKLNNCSAKDSSEISISDCCTDNLSHLTDHCTDIRNHLSPNTKVIER